MAFGFLVLNESTVSEVTTRLPTWIADLQLWLDRDFCPEYGRLSSPILLGAIEDPHMGHTTRLVDSCDDPSAVAYHTRDTRGYPVLQIGIRTAMAQANGLDEVPVAMGHEIGEAICNEYVNKAVQIPDGRWQMYEVIDPVQGDRYKVGNTWCPAFVTRAYWCPDAYGPYAIGSTLPGPLTIAPHGYRPFADGTAEFGEHVSEAKRAAILAHGRVARFGR